MADVELVRTVFQTEWLGGGQVANMIRQYGLAEKAVKQLQGSQATGGNSASAANRNILLQAKYAAGQQKIAQAFIEGKTSIGEATGALGKWNQDVFGATEVSKGFLSGLNPMVLGLGAVAVGVLGAAAAFKKLYPILEQGAEVAQLDSSFQNLNRSIGASSDLLDEMKSASQRTVSTMAAQEGFMTLVAGSSQEMSLALANAAPQLLEISKAANKLNPALGDTNFLFTSLAKGVKRAEPRLIDNLGLKLRVADANRTLAEQLGKSVAELTAEEKQLAILNETLRAGQQLINQVGGSVDGLGDAFQRVTAAHIDFKDELKQNLFLSISTGNMNSYALSVGNLGRVLSAENQIISAYKDEVIDSNEALKFRKSLWSGDAEQTRRNIDLIERRRQALLDEKAATQEATQAEIDRLSALYGTSPEVPARERAVPTSGLEFGDRRLGGKDYERLSAKNKRARDEAEETAKVEKKLFDERLDAAEKWAKGVEDASEKARDAWLSYTAELGSIAKAHAEGDRESSFFTRAIEDIGDAWITTGGATAEQKDLIDELQGAYDKAEKNVRQLESGVKGFGQEEEKTAEQIEKSVAAMDHYKTKLAEIQVAETNTVKVHQDAVWNWDNLRQGMADAASEAGISASQFAAMKVVMGDMTTEQGAAILAATAMETKMGELAERMKFESGFGFDDAEKELREFTTWLDQQDLSILIEPSFSIPEGQEEQFALAEGERGFEIQGRANTEQARQDLEEALFGEGVLPPAEVTVEVLTDDASGTLEVWRQTEGEVPILVPIEYIYPEGGPAGPNGGFPTAPGHAGGGNLMANHMALVGEQGPELIIPGSNSTVIPNNKLGGGGLNITINVDGGGNGDALGLIVEDALLEAMQRVGIL